MPSLPIRPRDALRRPKTLVEVGEWTTGRIGKTAIM